MNIVMNLVLGAQMLSAIVMVVLILLQHGKGADMGAAFGSGSSGSLFGASGSANFLSRSTAVLAGVFFVSTLFLAYFGNLRGAPVGSSVLQGVVAPAPAASAPAATGAAALIPDAAPAAAAAASKAPAPAASAAPAKPASK